ncbi:hypothetical protein DL93DRAFT_2100762 [Clavulina sp. PMI_390]|nr:hypothetical protein DL93DRAFT_2100762 [Clavulina sp. PMI_390]
MGADLDDRDVSGQCGAWGVPHRQEIRHQHGTLRNRDSQREWTGIQGRDVMRVRGVLAVSKHRPRKAKSRQRGRWICACMKRRRRFAPEANREPSAEGGHEYTELNCKEGAILLITDFLDFHQFLIENSWWPGQAVKAPEETAGNAEGKAPCPCHPAQRLRFTGGVAGRL